MGWADTLSSMGPKDPNDDQTVGASVTDPFDLNVSDASRATYEDLKLRWGRIELCLMIGPYKSDEAVARAEQAGVECRWPKVRNDLGTARHNNQDFYDNWTRYRDRWDGGDPDLPGLSAQVSNLTMAERRLNDAGASIKDAPKPAPDIADRGAGLKTADAVDKGAAEVEAGVKKVIVDSGGLGIAPLWSAIPLPIRVAGVLGVVGYGALKVARLFRK